MEMGWPMYFREIAKEMIAVCSSCEKSPNIFVLEF